jgi:hypothetical protein
MQVNIEAWAIVFPLLVRVRVTKMLLCQRTNLCLATAIIEDTFQKNFPDVLLNNYHIDFRQLLQISNTNIQK